LHTRTASTTTTTTTILLLPPHRQGFKAAARAVRRSPVCA
jgi:hypothetical protein